MISINWFTLGANIFCVAHTCHYDKRVERVERTVYTVFLAPRVLVASHVMLLSILIKQCLQCSNCVDCTELKANGQTVLLWYLGKWVNSWRAMSRLWMLLHPVAWIKAPYGTAAIEAGARNIEKYRELVYNGYFFQPVAFEVQGSLGESSEILITRLCKMLCRSHDDQRGASFLRQQISMALQIGIAACLLGTVRCVRRNLFKNCSFL